MVTTNPITAKPLCHINISKPWQKPVYWVPGKSIHFNRVFIYLAMRFDPVSSPGLKKCWKWVPGKSIHCNSFGIYGNETWPSIISKAEEMAEQKAVAMPLSWPGCGVRTKIKANSICCLDIWWDWEDAAWPNHKFLSPLLWERSPSQAILFGKGTKCSSCLSLSSRFQFSANHGLIQTSQSHPLMEIRGHLALLIPQSLPPTALFVPSVPASA